MKIRTGFVSNSSSSSFIIGKGHGYADVFAVVEDMLAQFLDHYEGEYDTDDNNWPWYNGHKLALARVREARKAGIDPDTPVLFTTSNNDTQIWKKDNKICVYTCNHIRWDLPGYDDDCPDDDSYDEERFFWCPESDLIGHESYNWQTPNSCACGMFKYITFKGHDRRICAKCEASLNRIASLVVLGPVTTKDGKIIEKNLVEPNQDGEKVWMEILLPAEPHHIIFNGKEAHAIKFGATIDKKIVLPRETISLIREQAGV
jgi:hypothetical protein